MTVFVSGTRIPDSLSGIVDSKGQDYGFQEQNFPDFRFLKIPLHGANNKAPK